MYNYPYIRPSLFGRWANAARGFSWSGFLDGTQKTLGVINQAIPIVNQVKPIMSNAKAMFKIADEINKPMVRNTVQSETVQASSVQTTNTNKPMFYM